MRLDPNEFLTDLRTGWVVKVEHLASGELTREEMQELVNRLFATEHPYYCPHGRPIIVQMSLDELDGRFERH